ncbi:hypothetical protein RIF29_07477 [Crotalaria pallida]|uniref:Uncharacterized protein n=1 Tax=Crotalaria pallida TaxID=3830 RepID=A0AAN9J4D4_CROPI
MIRYPVNPIYELAGGLVGVFLLVLVVPAASVSKPKKSFSPCFGLVLFTILHKSSTEDCSQQDRFQSQNPSLHSPIWLIEAFLSKAILYTLGKDNLRLSRSHPLPNFSMIS